MSACRCWAVAFGGILLLLNVAAGAGTANEAGRRGKICFDKGDLDAAVAAYTEAIRLDPRNAERYCDRGFAYCKKGNPDKALADCDEAIRLDPKRAGAYRARGVAHCEKGRLDSAIADCSEAIRLDPTNAE